MENLPNIVFPYFRNPLTELGTCEPSITELMPYPFHYNAIPNRRVNTALLLKNVIAFTTFVFIVFICAYLKQCDEVWPVHYVI